MRIKTKRGKILFYTINTLAIIMAEVLLVHEFINKSYFSAGYYMMCLIIFIRTQIKIQKGEF